MNWLTGLNPGILLAALLAAFVAGGAAAWTVQGYRLDALQQKYDGFVSLTKVQGEAARKAAVKQAANDQLRKEKADHENQAVIAVLHADIERMRKSRAAGSFVPAAPAGARRPELACFDRAELESAIRELDIKVQGLVDEGSEAAVNLDSAKAWAR